MGNARLLKRALSIVSSVVRLLLSLKKLLVAAIKESRMQGPIIKEHVTNGSLGPGEYAHAKYGRINVPSEGRRLRVYVKGSASSTGTIGYQLYVLPALHFSDIDASAYPTGATSSVPVSNPDFTVRPALGVATGSAADIDLAVYYFEDGKSSAFDVVFQTDVDTSVTGLYILTELV